VYISLQKNKQKEKKGEKKQKIYKPDIDIFPGESLEPQEYAYWMHIPITELIINNNY